MPGGGIAVIDTVVLVLLTIKSQAATDHDGHRRTLVLANMRRLQGEGYKFVVPSPVLAELYGGGRDRELVHRMIASIAKTRVVPFDERAAEATGQAMPEALATRANSERRSSVKYDLLIAGIAHSIGAQLLVTDDRRGFKKYFRAMDSDVDVFIATQTPPGKLPLIIPED